MGIVLVLVPPGSFAMGSAKGPRPDERPTRTIQVGAFYLSKYEMTQGQWERATGVNPSRYRPPMGDGGRAITLLNPVERVSWDDCERTLRWLGLKLPSEVQWEYAARAGTETEWWTGDDERTLQGAANLADQALERFGGLSASVSWDDGHGVHATVGSFRANAFGLHDVIGNVSEWTQDGTPTSRPMRTHRRTARRGIPTARSTVSAEVEGGPTAPRAAAQPAATRHHRRTA
jgi:formylglycine-generating enzyme required for sulfatase activity